MNRAAEEVPDSLAHLVARLAGEPADHPRQKIARWLEENGLGDSLGDFNQRYAENLTFYIFDPHKHYTAWSKAVFASYAAFAYILGATPGDPAFDLQWGAIVN